MFHVNANFSYVKLFLRHPVAKASPWGDGLHTYYCFAYIMTGLILARAMTLTQSRDIDAKNLLEYELAPFPTACLTRRMF